MKDFNPNSTFIYIVAGIVILFVLAQSIFFLIKSIKRAKQINMNMKTIAKTIGSTTVFTLAPAFSILLGVVTLSGFLGLPLPWIRLSVIGAITYELPAATSTANALGISLSEMISDPKVYTAIAWVMTLGILPSITLYGEYDTWDEIYNSEEFKQWIKTNLGCTNTPTYNSVTGGEITRKT